jgi:hypothetical protein
MMRETEQEKTQYAAIHRTELQVYPYFWNHMYACFDNLGSLWVPSHLFISLKRIGEGCVHKSLWILHVENVIKTA